MSAVGKIGSGCCFYAIRSNFMYTSSQVYSMKIDRFLFCKHYVTSFEMSNRRTPHTTYNGYIRYDLTLVNIDLFLYSAVIAVIISLVITYVPDGVITDLLILILHSV